MDGFCFNALWNTLSRQSLRNVRITRLMRRQGCLYLLFFYECKYFKNQQDSSVWAHVWRVAAVISADSRFQLCKKEITACIPPRTDMTLITVEEWIMGSALVAQQNLSSSQSRPLQAAAASQSSAALSCKCQEFIRIKLKAIWMRLSSLELPPP